MASKRMPRRTILRAAGIAIPLPLLDAMTPRYSNAANSASARQRNRMVLVAVPLGLHAPNFFPEGIGIDCRPSRYLRHLTPLKGKWTVFSGVSHRYRGGHGTRAGLMTGVSPENMQLGSMRNSISLDQEVCRRLKFPVRYSSLTLGRSGLSWNSKGMVIPAQENAVTMFQRLFIDGSAEEKNKQIRRLENGRSILDGVRDQFDTISRQLGARDRDRIDLMTTSIREAELLLQRDQQWVRSPKPNVSVKPFTDRFGGSSLIERQRQWLALVHLALMTDVVRVISLNFHSHAAVQIQGQQIGHHDASHHGQRKEKIEQLAMIEDAEMQVFAEFLSKLYQSKEEGLPLLDQTQVLLASDLGNASAHTTANLPVLLAGGGFKHSGHLEFDRKNNLPLANLFVRMMQRMGIEADQFGSSTGVMTEV